MRVNEGIRAREVRVVGEKGEQLGIMPTYQALDLARKKNLDMVEVAPTAVPTVCRIMDYGKFKYEQAKKEREMKKGQKVVDIREIRIRPKIGEHDFNAKARQVKKMLEGGDKVKVTVMYRGREITHTDIGFKLLQKLMALLQGVAVIVRQPFMEGQRMYMILSPSPKQQAKSREKEEKMKEAPKEKETVDAKN
ncbi:MAG: translation initiation factor IF-3 [Dehalococcoidia bacterium]|nr:translation initiation factor IF-3 [Dehalococcoidia bacterium]